MTAERSPGDRIPTLEVGLCTSEPHHADLRFRHQLLDDLIDGEAGRLLSRWELFEALEPLVHDRLRGVLIRDVLDEPVVVFDAVLAGPFTMPDRTGPRCRAGCGFWRSTAPPPAAIDRWRVPGWDLDEQRPRVYPSLDSLAPSAPSDAESPSALHDDSRSVWRTSISGR